MVRPSLSTLLSTGSFANLYGPKQTNSEVLSKELRITLDIDGDTFPIFKLARMPMVTMRSALCQWPLL